MHQTSCPYTPQQNGVAERKNRHLMEVSRSMMFHMKVPKRYWGDAVMMACYLINRTPTKILEDISPFEVLNKTSPSIEHLRVFGCVCFVLVPGELRSKLDFKSNRCVFLGYSTTQKGYKCYNPANNRTYVSRDVKFFEDQSYFDKKDWEDLKDLASSSDRTSCLRFLLDHLGNPSAPISVLPRQEETQSAPASTSEPHSEALPLTDQEIDHGQDEPEEEEEEAAETVDTVTEEAQERVQPTLRRSTRIRSDPSTWKKKRVYYNCEAVAHPIQAMCSLALMPLDHQVFLGKIDQEVIPQSYEEAMESKEWTDAVDDELGAMIRNHTWEESDLPKGKRTVSSK